MGNRQPGAAGRDAHQREAVRAKSAARRYEDKQCDTGTKRRTDDDDVVLRHTLPVFTGLGRCPIVRWDFAGTVSIFGPDALPVVHQ